MVNQLMCPVCDSKVLTLKHEASYVYSYQLDSNAPGAFNTDEFHSFQYDKREQTSARRYIECNGCGRKFSYVLGEQGLQINDTV